MPSPASIKSLKISLLAFLYLSFVVKTPSFSSLAMQISLPAKTPMKTQVVAMGTGLKLPMKIITNANDRFIMEVDRKLFLSIETILSHIYIVF